MQTAQAGDAARDAEEGSRAAKGNSGREDEIPLPARPQTERDASRRRGAVRAGEGAARSPGSGCRQPRALHPLSLLLPYSKPQRPRTAGVAAAAGAWVPPPPPSSRQLLRRRQQLQAAPQYSPPYHPWGEPSPGPQLNRRPPAARPGVQGSAEFAPGCPITYSL